MINLCEMHHSTTTIIQLYRAYDHSLFLYVTYRGGGVVKFDLEYGYNTESEVCCTDFPESYINFFDLSEEEMRAIAEGELRMCDDLSITIDEDRDAVMIRHLGQSNPNERMVIPRQYYGRVKREITRVIDDCDLMLEFMDRGSECLVVEDPKVQRVMVLACLHATFRRHDWDRLSEIYDYLDDESEPGMVDGSKLVKSATQLVDSLTTINVNEFLHSSGVKSVTRLPKNLW